MINKKKDLREGVKAKLFGVSYAFEKWGNKTYCAWCKERVDKWTKSERTRHVEAHDWSDKEAKSLIKQERGDVIKKIDRMFNTHTMEDYYRLWKNKKKNLLNH